MIIKPESKTKKEVELHFIGKVVSYDRKEEYLLHFKTINQFRGHISDDMLWVTKEGYSPYGAGRRYFIGKVVENDDGVIIDGHFRFHWSLYCYLCVIVFLLPFMVCLNNQTFTPYIKYIFIMLFLIGIVYLLLRFSFMKREEEIEKLLKSL